VQLIAVAWYCCSHQLERICTTCELVTTRAREILDVASPLRDINPFTTEDLSWQLDLQRVARNISAHIAKPTSRGEDPVVYGKAQYLAMIVRAMKLDGIRFSSSLDAPNGVNVALFDPTVVEYSNARIVAVTRTEIAYEAIEPQRFAPRHKP
jgi:RES domain